ILRLRVSLGVIKEDKGLAYKQWGYTFTTEPLYHIRCYFPERGILHDKIEINKITFSASLGDGYDLHGSYVEDASNWDTFYAPRCLHKRIRIPEHGDLDAVYDAG